MSRSALIESSAEGRLPAWAELSPARLAHSGRVAALLDEWALGRGADHDQRARWRSAGWLHDALRGAPVERLRPWVAGEFADLPGSFLHGPAAATRLAADGLDDAELLDAIRYHTIGHPRLGELGRALMTADFLEPGRTQRSAWRARLRARMPHEFEGVFLEVVRAKLRKSIDAVSSIPAGWVGLWNGLVGNAEAER